jgi:hypothetical protein
VSGRNDPGLGRPDVSECHVTRIRYGDDGPELGADELSVHVVQACGTAHVPDAGSHVLAAFNLIPIPPLDGSAVIERFLPVDWLGRWYGLQRYAMAILILLVLLIPGAVGVVVDTAIEVWSLLL